MHGLIPGDYARTAALKDALRTKPITNISSSPMTRLKVYPASDRPPVFLTTGM